MYMEPHIHEEIKDPAYLRDSETQMENKIYMATWPKDEVWELQRGEISFQDNKKGICSVISSFLCHLDRSKIIVSGYFYYK